MGVNLPSIESLELTTARKIVPHATSPKGENERRVCNQGEDVRGREEGNEFWKNTE
jgi:hypothetical protein